MADPFVAEIRIVSFNFPPTGWAACDGQLMPLSQNTALFSLLGTVYGGDGKSTFALPDLQGRATLHPGQGQGLPEYMLGDMGGSETVALLGSETPGLSHSGGGEAAGAVCTPAQGSGDPQGVAGYPTGGGQAHNNMMPYLALNYVIALQGVYPPRP